MWLSPFRKVVKAHSKMHAEVDGGKCECTCNSTMFDSLHSGIDTLTLELEGAKSSALDENRKANDILSLQYTAIRDLEVSIASLSSKQQEVMRVTDDSKRSEATVNIFSHIREDMQKLRSQVQSLSDTHMMIQQFNSHADNLSQRSKEIEALIVAQNESKNAAMSAECDCSDEGLSAAICGDGDDDYVNIDMARKIITDEVTRECKTKIDEIYSIYDSKMAVFGKECSNQCSDMMAIRDKGDAETIAERRINYASRRAGATIVHHQTSVTWAPQQSADLARRAVLWAADSDGWLNLAMRKATSMNVADAVDLSQVESTLRGMTDFFGLGVASMVGTPEDALSADMTLGSCWPMDQGKGHLTIKLTRPVKITGAAIEHVPSNEALDVRSAPKDFKIFAMNSEASEGNLVVTGSYSIDSGSPSLQNFDAEDVSCPVQYVRVEVMSNHGHPDYACLYRVSIYGQKDA